MCKLFTAKPGRTICLFLLLGIVALQWSFTTAGSGKNRAAHLLTDTSTTPVAGKTVATRNKPASARSNRTTTSSKPVLASNLERETISFGSPTGGPETEVSTPSRKTTVLKSAKTTGVNNTKSPGTKNVTAEKKNSESASNSTATKNTGTVNTTTPKTKSASTVKSAVADKKTVEGVNANASKSTVTKNTGTVNTTRTKTESVSPVKSAVADKKTVDGAGAVLIIKEERASTRDTKTKTTAAVTKTTKTTAGSKNIAAKTTGTKTPATTTKTSIGILSNKLPIYDSLHLKSAGLSKNVFTLALKGMSKLISNRHIKNNLLAIVDYSQPSNKKRLYVIDLNNNQLLYNTFVAHGMNTGRLMAQYFSNKPSSNKSSLGFYVTGPAYNGTNGYSLKLTGVEKGINDHALDRGIVIHGADYVCEGLIESQGFIGRSWGCPAVAQEVSQELIDQLKDGSCLFIYHPSPAYKAKSSLLK